jgi:hypothetical protein
VLHGVSKMCGSRTYLARVQEQIVQCRGHESCVVSEQITELLCYTGGDTFSQNGPEHMLRDAAST